MYKPESSQRTSTQRITLKRRDDNSLCITNNYMGNRTVSIDENAYLAACFRGKFSKVSCKFWGNYLIMYPSPIDPLEGVKITSLES
jgi:hypothetical protein